MEGINNSLKVKWLTKTVSLYTIACPSFTLHAQLLRTSIVLCKKGESPTTNRNVLPDCTAKRTLQSATIRKRGYGVDFI